LQQAINAFNAINKSLYQPVVWINTGKYGGPYAMAPYKERHHRLIAHATGKDQVAINTFELNMFDNLPRNDEVSDENRKTDIEKLSLFCGCANYH
jgi:hypothetical protein